MAFCPNCGTNNPDDAKFCSGCGAPVVVQAPAAPPVEAPVAEAAAAAAAAVVPEIPTAPEIPAAAAPQAPVTAPEAPAAAAPQAPVVPELTFNAPQPTYTPQQPDFTAPQYQQPTQAPAPVATGGLLAWSIVTILLCWIPGLVALLNVLRINKCATAEEQAKRISQAKLWCIIGTVLGVISLIFTFANGGPSRFLN